MKSFVLPKLVRIRNPLLLIVFIIIIGSVWNSANGAARFAVTTGNWTGSIWATTSGGTAGSAATPTSSDSVVVNPGVTVTLQSSTTISYLIIGAFQSGSSAAVLTHSSANPSLTVTVNVTVHEGNGNFTNAWNINGGSATVSGNVTIGDDENQPGFIAKVAVTSGTLTIAGNLIFSNLSSNSGSSAATVVDLSGGAATLNIGGTINFFVNNNTVSNGYGSLIPGTSGSTVNFNSSSAQTVVFAGTGGFAEPSSGFFSYYNLTLSGGGVKSLTPTENNSTATLAHGVLSIAPSGSSSPTISIPNNDNLTVNRLWLGGAAQASGTWGSSTATGATNHQTANNTYFAATTGFVTVSSAGTNVSFSNLTASQTICVGTASVTLTGKVSNGSTTYPANGETVKVTINNVAQSTTINDATGDFSIAYNTSALTANTYTITYTYGGNSTLNSATNTATTLTAGTLTAAPTVTVTNNCGSSTLSTTATGSLSWSPGSATTSSITVTTSGTYSVTQTVGGCPSPSGTGTAAPNTIPGTPTVTGVDNCNSTSTLSTTATGVLLWTGGATTSSITVTSAGTFSVTQTVSGCTSSSGTAAASPKSTPSTPSVSVTNNCNNTSTLSTTATGTLSWTGGASTSAITVTSAGTYSVITTVNTCASAPGTGTAAPHSAPTASAGKTDVLCNGGSTGTATSTTSGGTIPYTYLWTGGATTSSITGKPAGTYTLTVSDANSCSSSVAVTIGQPASALSASAVKTDVLCNGGSTGTATSNTSGGTIPYTYSWSSGETTSSISGKPAATYTLTVTDANSCTSLTTVTIGQPSALVASASKTDVLCNGGSTGTATSTSSGGTIPYTYSWSNGETTSSINGKSIGTYTLTITDAHSCTSLTTVTIGQPASALVASASKTDVLCNGASTGTATSTTSGGTIPYTYFWTGGATTSSITGKVAGTYTLTVTDANSCTSTTTVTTSQPSALVASAAKTDVLCNGGSTGTASSTSSGGTIPYTYSWSSGETTSSISGKAIGTYTLTVTDANSCTSTTTVTISQPSALVASAAKTDVLCNGGSTGTATSTSSGGTTPYTYSWSSGETTSSISGKAAASYTLTVTDANSCISSTTVTIGQPSALAASAGETDVLCNGGATGTATSTTGGGTAPYTYLWTGGATTSSISNKAATTYTLTVTDAHSCSSTTTVTISQPASALSASANETDVLCNGASTGTATSTTSGGTIPYTYLWTGGATTSSISGKAAATYTLTVTDANSCISTTTATISQPSALVASAAKTDVLCNGGSTGTATSTTGGGTIPYTYSWSSGETTSSINGKSMGTYTLTVTDANSCTNSITVTIGQPSALVASAAKTDVLCNGGSTGTATSTSSGGTAPYTYSWSSGETTSSIIGKSIGTYTLTVTDANSCTSTTTATISQPSALLASASKTDVLCNGALTGTATSTTSGGNTPYTYLWTGGATTSSISGKAASTYTLTVTDANSCTSTTTATISQPSALVASASKTDVLCNGGSTGTATSTTSGGTIPYTYLWTGGATTSSISGKAAGTYTLTVTDANSCTSTTTAIISQPSALVALASKTDVLCNGGSTGTATSTTSGGTIPYTYSWSSGETTSSINGKSIGTYTLTVTDGNGCTNAATVTIGQPSALVASTSKTDVLCNGGATGTATSTTSGGTTPYTYLWSDGATTSSINGKAIGTYTLKVTDANSCSSSTTVTIGQPVSALSASASKTDVLCNGGSTGTATSITSGGTVPYTYLWTGGATTSSISGKAAGTYTLTVTDANSCTNSTTVTIGQPSALVASASKTDVLCNGGSTGTVTSTTSGGTTPYTYTWTGGATTSSISGKATGAYTLIVTDANSCTSTTTVTIGQPSAIVASATKTDVLCNGGSTGTATSTTSGGTIPYTYLWSDGATTSSISGKSIGTYTLTVTDANSCTSSTTVGIGQPAALVASATKTDVLCNGGATGTATSTTSGGTVPYTYLWTGGATTSSISGKATGTYTLTVTDANSCISSTTVTIGQPAAALAASAIKTDVLCNGGSTGTATSTTSGGTISYIYLWTGGATTSSVSGKSAGTYTLTVTDANSCTSSTTVTIGQPSALVASASKTDVSCNGGSNGTATSTTSGGTTPYTYAWTGGTTSSISGKAAGSYTLTVTDANSCTNSTTVTIGQPAAVPTPTVTVTNNCGNTTLSTTASGTLAWSAGATTSSVTVTAAGTYSVTQTVGGCASPTGTGIAAPKTIPSAPTVTVTNNCSSSTLSTTATGTLAWSTAATTTSIAVTAAGTYSVTTTVNACTSPAGTGIAAPSTNQNSGNPTSASASSTSICTGTSVTLTLNGGGGGGSTETVKWYTTSCGSGLAAIGNGVSVSPTSTTTYYGRYEDGTPCSFNTSCQQVTVTVSQKSADPTSITNSVGKDTICNGQTTALTLNGGGGGTSETIKWYSGSCGGTFVTSGNSVNVSPTTTTTYYGRYEDGSPCSYNSACASYTITVNQESGTPVSANATKDTICSGDTTFLSLNGGGGGTGEGITWWTTVCGGIFVGSGNNIAVHPGTSTLYYGRYEDPFPCHFNTTCATVNIVVNQKSGNPTSASAGSSTICNGGSTTLTLNGGGGGTGQTIKWYTGSCGGTLAATGNGATVSPTTTTTYFGRYEQSSKCTGNSTCQSVTVTVKNKSADPSSASASPSTICTGSSATLTLTGGGGGTGETIKWYSGSCGGTLVGTGNSLSVSPTTTTTYFGRYEDGTPCNNSACVSATVTVNAASVGGSIAGSTNVCTGTNSGTLTLSGNTGSITKWQSSTVSDFSAGVVDISNTTSTLNFTNLTVTTYYRAVVTNGVCSSANSGIATITVNPVSVGGTATVTTSTICQDSSTTVVLSGNTGSGIQWQQSSDNSHWANVTSGSGATTATYTTPALSSKTYYRAAVTSGACSSANSSTDSVSVNLNSTISVTSGNASQTICLSGAIATITYAIGGAGTGASVSGLPPGLTTSYSGGVYTISGTPTLSGTFNYTVSASGSSCVNNSAGGTMQVNGCSAVLSAKLYIESYYLGSGKMSPLLTLLGASTNANDVDSVTIELHSKANLNTAAFSASGIIKNDGTVSCTFGAGVINNYYYLVIKHRNSIATWSADSVHFTTSASFDFTTSANKAYGSNMINLGDGNYAIYSGDVNQDGNIDATDYFSVEGAQSSFIIGAYDSNDVTGDGRVDASDYRVLQNNTLLNLSVRHP